jgi:hypothetical protein
VRCFLYSPSCGARGRMTPSPRWALRSPSGLKKRNFCVAFTLFPLLRGKRENDSKSPLGSSIATRIPYFV